MLKKFLKFLKSLNYLDLAFLSILFLLGFAFFLFFYRKAEYVTVRVKVTDQDILYQNSEPKNWYADKFYVGDKQIDTLGRPIAEITKVETFNIDSQHKAVYLDLKVRTLYDSRTKLYSALGKSLMFGTPLRFNLSKVVFTGFVTDFPRSEYQKDLKISTITLSAISRGVEPSLAEAIKEGDKILDSNGVVLAEVKKIDIKPSERVTQTSSGDLLLRYDPLYKDIFMTVNVRTKTYQSEMYIFDNLPLKIGEYLPLNFPNVSVFPTISSISK
jgi:hypothetical protein